MDSKTVQYIQKQRLVPNLLPFKVVIDAVATFPCGKLDRKPFTFPSVGGIKCASDTIGAAELKVDCGICSLLL
jgi:hypothetical protein